MKNMTLLMVSELSFKRQKTSWRLFRTENDNFNNKYHFIDIFWFNKNRAHRQEDTRKLLTKA